MREHSLFTWTAQRDFVPFALGGGAGAWFWDQTGRRYLDLGSVAFNVNAGHNHPRILEAMRAQLGSMATAGPWMQTPIREEASAALARVTPPGLSRFLFTLGGADANEHAVKMACLMSGRRKVIARASSYHGSTWGALSFSDDPRTRPYQPALPGVVRVKEPICHHCPWETRPEICDRPCADEVEAAILREGPETVAAVLMETVPGVNGGYFPPADYYRRLRRICDHHGVLLILDEVLTGFGRTGRWFAADDYGAREEAAPDMMVLGKGITSGHAPLGAVAVSDRVADHFQDHQLLTGLTSSSHPICLAALRGNLEALREGELVSRAAALGRGLADRLEAIRARRPLVAFTRARGLYGCLELNRPVGTRVKEMAMERGVHLPARGSLVFVAPPLVISPEDLDRGLEIVEDLLDPSRIGC